MTEFQLGLLLIGALAIVGVIVYNRVQERLATRRAERAFGSQYADVLLGESAPRREPTMEAAIRKPDRESGTSTQALPDHRLDYVIGLSAPQPMSAATFLEYWKPLEHRFGKRILAAGGDGVGPWKRIVHGEPAVYSAFQTALQLVSRAGVVNEAELIEFRSEVENLAAAQGASAVAPEMKQAMDRARELDQFCGDADIQIVLNLVPPPGSTLPAAKLKSAITAAGLGRELDGQYALRDANGCVLYSLSLAGHANDAEVTKLGFSLDVPRAPEVRRTYESMVRFARQLAAGVGGSLVDDNGRPLDAQALATIGSELDAVRQALEARGVAPGGSLALRLFS